MSVPEPWDVDRKVRTREIVSECNNGLTTILNIYLSDCANLGMRNKLLLNNRYAEFKKALVDVVDMSRRVIKSHSLHSTPAANVI
jgi:hypothetical protein